ncbi:MAG: hypothetical protein ACK5P6_05865 [Pseudobdellovibrionaceae bacterium]|jgi:hypothetical protein
MKPTYLDPKVAQLEEVFIALKDVEGWPKILQSLMQDLREKPLEDLVSKVPMYLKAKRVPSIFVEKAWMISIEYLVIKTAPAKTQRSGLSKAFLADTVHVIFEHPELQLKSGHFGFAAGVPWINLSPLQLKVMDLLEEEMVWTREALSATLGVPVEMLSSELDFLLSVKLIIESN